MLGAIPHDMGVLYYNSWFINKSSNNVIYMQILYLVWLSLQPSDDDTISLHSQVSESTREQTLRNDNHVMGSKLDPQKGNICCASVTLGKRIVFLKVI